MDNAEQPRHPAYPGLVSRLCTLRSFYRHLEIDYGKLPLSARRYMYGNVNESVADVRMIATNKLSIAAILQWSPTSFNFSVQAFLDAGEPVMGTTAGNGNELCPVWKSFFDEVTEADRLLATWASSDFVNVHPFVRSELVDTLLTTAETKLGWAQNMLDTVTRRGEYVRQGPEPELSQRMVNEGWNRFCLNVLSGAFLGTTTTAAKSDRRSSGLKHGAYLPFELSMTDGKRFYFPTNLTSVWEPGLEYGFASSSTTRECQSHSQVSLVKPDMGVRTTAYAQVPMTETNGAALKSTTTSDPAILELTYEVSSLALVPARSPLGEYNARWNAISPNDPQIPWPTTSHRLDDLMRKRELSLGMNAIAKMTTDKAIEIKTMTFFLKGLGIEYRLKTTAMDVASVVVDLKSCSWDDQYALKLQLMKEEGRWDAVSLSKRSGLRGEIRQDLGNDFVVVAIRSALSQMREIR